MDIQQVKMIIYLLNLTIHKWWLWLTRKNASVFKTRYNLTRLLLFSTCFFLTHIKKKKKKKKTYHLQLLFLVNKSSPQKVSYVKYLYLYFNAIILQNFQLLKNLKYGFLKKKNIENQKTQDIVTSRMKLKKTLKNTKIIRVNLTNLRSMITSQNKKG
jgi:hypothetical protein